MPREILNLLDEKDLQSVNGAWRFAPGLVPGEPNEGLVSQLEGTPARLVDYDDSGWEVRNDRRYGTPRDWLLPGTALK